jgi:hypothetical protein
MGHRFLYIKNSREMSANKPLTSLQQLDSSLSVSFRTPVAEFKDPWLGDKVNSGIGLSYRPASHVASVPVQQNNPLPELTLPPYRDLWIRLQAGYSIATVVKFLNM